ncbi:hypothetical protein [Streptomyces beihaiensis]|uniref:Lipoprotein n=1 Tax=Streptomyces beihaiensis TaxID=2984495 RepID=A0ABT3TN87_9ACTN|nr:hypothetical protein [Streptomyces beihaiensis]MCX3058509.1 hypothetical protein [Streptomyces beihaiensis]
MRGRTVKTVKAVCAVPLLALALAGCQRAAAGSGGRGLASPAGVSVGSPSGYGAVFLAVGECGARGRTTFYEVSCGSERAVARVTARYSGPPAGGPACPPYTDFVVHISESGDGTVAKGYACMRALEAPHPGDPGGGGGPRTVVGDCVYATGAGQVRETACDGSGPHKPEFRVASAVVARADCPKKTDLYVTLGGARPVGCAVRL